MFFSRVCPLLSFPVFNLSCTHYMCVSLRPLPATINSNLTGIWEAHASQMMAGWMVGWVGPGDKLFGHSFFPPLLHFSIQVIITTLVLFFPNSRTIQHRHFMIGHFYMLGRGPDPTFFYISNMVINILSRANVFCCRQLTRSLILSSYSSIVHYLTHPDIRLIQVVTPDTPFSSFPSRF